MKTILYSFVLFFIAILIASCSSGKKELVQEKPDPDKKSIKEFYDKDPRKYTKRVLADRCRIVGTVKEIDTTRFLDNPDAPCGKTPCYATIIIDEVLSYGSGFSPKLHKGQELEVNFKFTLEPTDNIAPELQLGLPGLKTGGKFIADLEALPVIGEDKKEYTIYRYELKD